MTIYGIYIQNGNRAGFWVQHRSWNNICSYVQRIDGQESGRLPGTSPLHNHAKVQARAFDVRSGRPMTPDKYGFDPTDRNFVPIAQPAWSHSARAICEETHRPLYLQREAAVITAAGVV
jgi:hypothetical protein